MHPLNNYRLMLLNLDKSEAFFSLIESNRDRLEDFFAGVVKQTRTVEMTYLYCKEVEKKIGQKTYFPYLIIDSKVDKIIGLIDVKNIDWHIPKAELGAFIDAEYEGKGIVTKQVGGLIDDIVELYQFKKLFCRVAPKNKRSIAVVLNLGFELEGQIKCDYRTTHGKLVDLNYYGKVF